MQTGALTLAFLALTVGQASNDVFVTNQRNLSISLSDIPPSARQTISQFRLFASTDQGRSWAQADAITPDKSSFEFRAKEDGTYWFRVALVNLQGSQVPENLYQGPPDQKMIIDTVKPIIDMTARRQGDDILASWSVQEDHPDMHSLRLEYRMKDGPPNGWNIAPFNGNLRGQAQFRVNQSGAVVLRLTVRDQGGNLSLKEVEVGGIALAGAQGQPIGSNSGYSPPPNFQADPGHGLPPGALDADPGLAELPKTPIASNGHRTLPPTRSTNFDDPTRKPLASNERPMVPDSLPPQAKPSNLPQVRYLNSTNLTFEYEISKLSPSGIGVVEVYWTLNDGHSWEQFADDPKSGPSMLPGRYRRRIELPGDGVYGFTCVALSRAAKEMKDKAGVNPSNKPKEGDGPEIRVEVDTIPPVVELFAPVPDKQRENTLILSWTAKDKNLAAEPISLEWAENPEGPWQACGPKQTNNGRFSWTLPQRIPVQVYLRVKATDLAANEGIAVTHEPLYVDLGQPQARFVDVFVTQQAPAP